MLKSAEAALGGPGVREWEGVSDGDWTVNYIVREMKIVRRFE